MKIVLLSLFLFTVMTGYAQQKRYPYVQNRKIIVCREGTEGVISSLIHPNWTTTPSHDETDAANNRLTAKFEVAAKDIAVTSSSTFTLQETVSRCASYSESSGDAGTWRVPTIRELRLIYALRDELDNLPNAGSYWSYTTVSSDSNKAWGVRFDNSTIRGSIASFEKSTYNFVRGRCIRDL